MRMNNNATPDPVQQLAKRLGQRLRVWREQRGLSPDSLADKLGYHRTTVVHAEHGRQMPSKEFFLRCQQQVGGAHQLLQLHRKLMTPVMSNSRPVPDGAKLARRNP